MSGSPLISHRRDLVAAGVGKDRIRRAVRSGRWQEPVPGVVVQHSGELTTRERREVALSWAGEGGRLSHTSALVLHRARVQAPSAAPRVSGVRGAYVQPEDGGLEQVTVPHGRHLKSCGLVVVHQSRRPLGDLLVGGLAVTSAARAAVDVAATARRRQDVEHVVADVLQRELTDLAELAAETRMLGRSATPWLRQTLTDAARGMRSVGESDLRRVVRLEGLPEPTWNAPVETAEGTFHLDALWEDLGVAAEADGTAFHLSAADWQFDLWRQNAVQGTGLRVFRFPVPRMRAQPRVCGRELRRALDL